MTQPDRPDRAAAERRNTDRVAAALRQAAASYEPDGERIRRLMDARAAAMGGSPVPRRPEPRGVRGRTVLWPVLGSAAAAAVIVGVAASGATTEGPHPVVPAGTSLPVAGDPSGGSSGHATAPLPSAMSTNVSSSASGSASGTAGTPTTPSSGSASAPVKGGTSHPAPAHGPASATGSAPVTQDGSAGLPTTQPPAAGAPSTSSTGAGRIQGQAPAGGTEISGSTSTHSYRASARPVPGGQDVTLGDPGTHWAVASTVTGQPRDVSNDNQLGPVQPLASGASVRTSPFAVRWTGGASPATGTASTWLVTPSGAGTGKGLRVPLRYRELPTTVTLYVGTVDGGGQVQISLDGKIVPLDLPSCSGTCAAEVTVTISGATASATPTGDVTLDVVPSATSQVGVAAAVVR